MKTPSPPYRPFPRSWLRRTAWAVALGLTLLLSVKAVWRASPLQRWVREKILAVVEARVGPVGLGEDIKLSWTGELSLGPLELRSGPRHWAQVRRVTVVPAWLRCLRGTWSASRIRLEGVSIDAGDEAEPLREWARQLRARRRGPENREASPSSEPLPLVTFDEVTLRIGRPLPSPFTFGPYRGEVSVHREAGSPQVAVKAWGEDVGELTTTVNLGEGPDGELHLRGASVPGLLRAFGGSAASALPKGFLNADLAIGRSSDKSARASLTVTAHLEVKALEVTNERLAPGPVGPLAFSADAVAHWQAEGKMLQLQSLRLLTGDPQVPGEVDAEGTLVDGSQFELRLRANRLDFPKLAASLPDALSPGAPAQEVEGTIGGSLTLHGPVHRRSEWSLEAALDLSALKPGTLDPKRSALVLDQEFTYRPVSASGEERPRRIGRSNPLFVPVDELPPVLLRSVLLSEDSMFYAHHGFDFAALGQNLFDDPGASGVIRGGSTLTQQLAKNLYLSREKTFARKIREAFLTIALEARLPKRRLLELYLNLIEWGPNVYGIGEAAAHYFGKDARALTVKECAFLATIIPNPIRYHVYWTRGALSEVWEKRVRELLTKLASAGDLNGEQLEEALAVPLQFQGPGTSGSASP